MRSRDLYGASGAAVAAPKPPRDEVPKLKAHAGSGVGGTTAGFMRIRKRFGPRASFSSMNSAGWKSMAELHEAFIVCLLFSLRPTCGN